jgi:hypothetical protein
MDVPAVKIFVGRRGRLREIFELRGGGTSCLSVPRGRWSVQARSTDCKSSVVSVRVVRSRSTTISVIPREQGSTYICGWELR